MKIIGVAIRNFRRLENVQIDIEERESIFVGPNNSGKTSATAIFRCFLGGRDFKIHDFSVARMADFDAFADTGDEDQLPKISLDLWFSIDPESIAFGRVFTLLPKLLDLTRVGIRLSYEVEDAAKLTTTKDRPLCLMIFIEEPEVHLHAQVQQTFISNIWEVINQSAKDFGEPDLVPQLVVTTHSSHILEAVDFEKVRYFQRSNSGGEKAAAGIRNVSEVRSLRAFQPEVETINGKLLSPSESLAFLKRYLRLTHCDLFFADAAILVEGAVEKLLMPAMIGSAAKRLRTTYLTVLEVGGAYAHRFEGLLSFLHIPYLVITDLDSVQPKGQEFNFPRHDRFC